MRFKEFTNIDSLRHAKVDEKPVKNFNGDYKKLSISFPPTNSSKATLAELNSLKELMSKRTSEIEDSVKIGRAHVRTPVTRGSRMPSSA